MAQELAFTVMATTLAVFKIRKVKDANGVDITPKAEYTHGSIVYVALNSL